jgi:hypothetical protein
MASQINASIVSARNENTLALANVSLDFSLFKVQPPVEFTGLGNSLSEQRRNIAEDGPPHRTARKLGALFEQLIPSTPRLIKAYGIRASEISRSAAAAATSPGGGKDGVFLQHVGADATSLWAAATSGASAISAHLLACMLARTWPGPEAVAIWVEIVAERTRMIIENSQQDAYNTPMGALFAAQTGISRKELADWDASARAWLQVADDDKQLQQKQLLLIVRNISLPVNEMISTFSSVTEAWCVAMVAVEKLISGQPQSASKGAVLLGLASWSLYPDLLVLAETPTPVHFSDELFSTGGTLTIGLENSDSANDDGVYWSLALSHLRYYGDPVISKTLVASQGSRINIEELHLLCLGSVLAGWGELGSDVVAAAEFFVVLWERIQEATIDPDNPEHYAASDASWLSMLVSASRKLLLLEGQERQNALSIVAFGRRKARRFLAEPTDHPPPMFGLSALFVTNCISNDRNFPPTDDDVMMMRTVAQQLQLPPGDCIIRIKRQDRYDRDNLYEYATAVPHRQCFESDKGLGTISHRRWIESTFTGKAEGGCECHGRGRSCDDKCRCIAAGMFCSRQCHDKKHPKGCGKFCIQSCRRNFHPSLSFECENEPLGCYCHGKQPMCFQDWCICIARGLTCTSLCHDPADKNGCGLNCEATCAAKNILPLEPDFPCSNTRPGETVLIVERGYFQSNVGGQHGETMSFQFQRIDNIKAKFPGLPHHLYVTPTDHIQLSAKEELRKILLNDEEHQTLCECYTELPIFRLLTGDPSSTALFIRMEGTSQQIESRDNRMKVAKAKAKSKPWTSVKVATHMVRYQSSPTKLLRFMSNLTIESSLRLPCYGNVLEYSTFEFDDYMRSLEALSLATRCYQELARATISIDVISRPLHKSLWVPSDHLLIIDPSERLLKRQELFCCIAMLDSGIYNLRPSDLEDVMAISVRNTIYVSRTLLCDPYDASSEHRIALVVGNVGKAGMVLMVAPQAPRVRKPDLDHWRQIIHAAFDGKSEDSFKATSLHLSFTDFALPLDASKKRRGAIDSDLTFVETLISAHDRGKWVADLDVLAIYKDNAHLLQRYEPEAGCSHDKSTEYPHQLTSLDNWEEILDVAEDFGHGNVGIVRANNNWLARIAAACVSVQLGHKTVVLPSNIDCWHCCCERNWKWGKAPASGGTTEKHKDGGVTPTPATTAAWYMPEPDLGGHSDNGDDDGGDNDDLYDSENESKTPFGTDALALALENDGRAQPQIFIC